MPKSVIVTIQKTKRKSQPYLFTVDKPGPAGKETKKEYYARPFTAKRGALRQLQAFTRHDTKDPWTRYWCCSIKGKVYPIEFKTK